MRPKALLLGSVGAVCLIAAAITSGTSTASTVRQQCSPEGCQVPARQLLSSENTREGIPEAAAWRANDDAQVAPERSSGSRVNDAEPHWGGARIQNQRTDDFCTSGFAIDTASAGKAIVSAGHCGLVDDRFRSGDHGYGAVTHRGNYPERDMLIINADNQNYDDDIYMNPIWNVGNPIDVGGTRTVSQGNHVCISGAFSLTSCDLEVAGVNGFFCDNPTGPCTENLVRYNVGEGACTSGDSGAPVFSQWGDPTYARVVGMHIARGSNSAQGAPNGCLAHKFGTIENTFNVTVATNP